MIYDFELIKILCDTYCIKYSLISDRELEVEYNSKIKLRVINAENEVDSLIYFVDSKWHFHDDWQYIDEDYNEFNISYLEFIEGIMKKEIFICNTYKDNELYVRSAIHRNSFFSDYHYLKSGERIEILCLK